MASDGTLGAARRDGSRAFSCFEKVNGVANGFRDMPAATFCNDWTDDGTGWLSNAALPHSFSNPPTVAKLLWCNTNWNVTGEAMSTVASPLGGVAFDGTGGQKLTRIMSDDLRRLTAATVATWACPSETDGMLLTLQGINNAVFQIDYGSYVPTFAILNGMIELDDMEEGDWYFIAVRIDPSVNQVKLDVFRLRDGNHVTGSDSLWYHPLTSGDNYINEGILGVFGVNGSFHHNYGEHGYFDRIGLWNRALRDDEVLQLYNDGAGWRPS